MSEKTRAQSIIERVIEEAQIELIACFVALKSYIPEDEIEKMIDSSNTHIMETVISGK